MRLVPLTIAHEDGLRAAAADGELWKLRITSVPEPENTRAYIDKALSTPDRLPFAVLEAASGRVLGTTSYHDIVPELDRVEIGWTWYAQSCWRTAINTACKLALLRHAFDDLGAALVGWRTDILNTRSQAAIERLGARKEGVIRHDLRRRDGTVRDTVRYSLLASEWPATRAHLEAALARR
ncbi:RimJ/RimL family protein N-acetyltransferase [Inhella inkyongensis]|uniref:RimJ/RimL family protein N-acetyltransferase n=1 Tax=Inhella inkyongensis TaxID=392593 RepID=A0A840S1N3_9BURK|nr:GNAT family protein [Inhella inkyongensis]MBB5203653.1 RimJ/RimL family protein N-acetyltransferase [Inhella inkyongensis]